MQFVQCIKHSGGNQGQHRHYNECGTLWLPSATRVDTLITFIGVNPSISSTNTSSPTDTSSADLNKRDLIFVGD